MLLLIILLSTILGIGPIWIAELLQKHPGPMPPATDAEEADALPFGPAPGMDSPRQED